MRLGNSISWLLLVVFTMGLLASLLSVPVWMQNRYLGLMRERSVLERDRQELEARRLQLKLEIGRLSSMSRLVPVAYSMGLSFSNIPVKVMEIPGNGGRR